MLELVRKSIVVLLVVIWLFPGSAPAQAAPAGPPPAPPATAATLLATAPSPQPGSAADVERFAQRERQAGQLERFEGGSSIGTTTIIIILLLVIILVLVIR
jgi:hypothetical protein